MRTHPYTRFATALFVIIALVAMMIPASSMADTEPTSGSLIIHKYAMSNTLDATPGDGTVQTPPAGATPLDGITFKIYSVVVDTSTDSQGVYPDTSGAITVTYDSSGDPASITDVAGNTFTVTAVASPNDSLSSTGIVTGSDGSGAATTGTIPEGIYLAIEQTPPASMGITSISAPFIVAVPMASADGTSWINPVNVYPKNEAVAVSKTANVQSVSVGDKVSYTITAGVPADLSDIQTYTINDTLDNALNFDSITTPLEATDNSGNSIEVPAGDYTISPTSPSSTGNTPVAVTFSGAGITWLAANKIVSVQVVLNATVNSNITTSVTATNTATASFTNNSGITTTTNPSPVPPALIHTGTITVTKQDDLSGDPLSGAVFKVASSQANAEAGNYLETDASGNILDVGDSGYGATGTNPVTITTGSNGIGSVSGLADQANGSPATYWITETTAPAGYNLLVSPVQVDFSGAAASNNWTAAITVKDSKGFVLPLTGAAGVALFTIIGIVLVGCAIILTVNMKKKRTAQAIK